MNTRPLFLGVTVERRTELVSFEDNGSFVTARLRGPGGDIEVCEAEFLAGCDGARSLVRETLGTGFPGGTYEQLFYVADVQATGPAISPSELTRVESHAPTFGASELEAASDPGSSEGIELSLSLGEDETRPER